MKVICLDRGVVILLVAVPAIAFTLLHYDSAFPWLSGVVGSVCSLQWFRRTVVLAQLV